MGRKAVRLTFSGPVHFGEGRLSDSGVACDAATLFSALFIEALGLDAASDLLQAAKAGNLRISDAFPFIGEDYYLPKPMVRIPRRSDEDARDGSVVKKASKKLEYVRSSDYRAFMDGKLDVVGELERYRSGIGKAGLQTKVNLTRADVPDALPYQVGGFRFAADAGIYFLVDGSFDIAPFLDSLRYSGIGGKRSAGYGRFDYCIADDVALPGASGKAASPRYVLLSTSAPTYGELADELLEDARYRLVRRGGFVQSGTHHPNAQKKRDMYLFASGAVFAHRYQGDVFDVNATPGAHSVYRYGRAMWLEV